MPVTKVSVQDQQGSQIAYSDPKTKPKYVEKYTKYKHKIQTVRSNHKKPIIVPKRQQVTEIWVNYTR